MRRVYFTSGGQSLPLCGDDILVSSTEAKKPRVVMNLKQLILGFELYTPFIHNNICTLENDALG